VDTTEPLELTEFREKYARPLLGEILGFKIAEDAEDPRLRYLTKEPSEPSASPASSERLLALLLEPDHDEADTRAVRGKLDKALLEKNLPYGFILTPSILRLVRRPGDGNKNAYLDFSIATATESEDVDSLIVAHRILNAGSFTPNGDGHAPIELLEQESRKHSAKVSDDLKQAVFTSAELLIRGLLDDVRQRPDVLTPQPPLTELRDAALLMLYRLLFILYAESRDERLQTHKLYLESYSLERLVDRLLLTDLAAVPGNRYTYWEQLAVLFRIYNEGLNCGNIPGLQNIPPRGGTLFSEQTKDGKLLRKVRLPDDLTAKLLITLATTLPRRGVGRERVSFRELEIQQLGAVYEGLLEYEPRVADGTMIEVCVQGKEYVLSPAELCRLCDQKSLLVKGAPEIVEGTDASRLHPELAENDEEDETAADQEEEADEGEAAEEGEDEGVKKGAAARLIRRLEKGDFYFVLGSSRKSSGSYYTREEIVQYLVSNALHDLVEGKSAADILGLRIIDPACGSGHFLVGAARYLGKRLLDAYRRELKNEPPTEFYPNRDLTPKVHEEWEKEGEAWCKRRIVERCLFGVDLNPTAVQLAQVALWIESLAGDRPLSFFAHHIRCGNSLLGTWLDRLRKPLFADEDGEQDNQLEMFAHDIDQQIAAALDERLLIDAELPPDVRKDTPQEYEYKSDRLQKAEGDVAQAKLFFCLRNAAAFLPAVKKVWWTLLRTPDLRKYAEKQPWWSDFERVCAAQKFFHWELEFPEVFRGEKKGFDCVLGNPPWDKVKPDRKEFYGRVDVLIRAYTGGELDVRIRELHTSRPELEGEFDAYADNVKTTAACLKKGGDYKFCDWEIEGKSTGGDPDLFRFFVERGHQILRVSGRLGFLVPGAIYSGEGATGLRHLLLDESRVLAFYGFENRHKLFPIDSRYKFVCLAVEKSAGSTDEAQQKPRIGEFVAAFMRHDLEELEVGPPAGVQVLVKRSELEKLSPGTLAFLEYRSELDRKIITKMYGILPGMTPRPLVGDQGEATWKTKLYRELDMGGSRNLWTRVDGKLWTPKEICGLDWPLDSTIPFAEVLAAMASKGFWPLYEGKHIEQFLLGLRPIERWVRLDALGSQPPRSATRRRTAFRRIGANTNEHTFISAVIPENSFISDTLVAAESESLAADSLCTMFNSFALDYALRMRGGMTHVDQHVVRCLPSSVPPALTIATAFREGCQHITDQKSLWSNLWSVNRAVAETYGLGAAEFEHIISTFPGVTRKRPAFFAYLQGRVKEWKVEGQQ